LAFEALRLAVYPLAARFDRGNAMFALAEPVPSAARAEA